MTTLTTGDDFNGPFTLYKVDPLTHVKTAEDVSGATDIKAVVVDHKETAALSAVVTLSAVATGADWTNGIVVVEMTEAETAAITTYGRASLQIKYNDASGEETTWHTPILIRQGFIV